MAGPTERWATGTDYLDLVTRLAQRMRLAEPLGGVWEAADYQWWWRRPRPSDDLEQLFWLDEKGDPVAGVVLTSWDDFWQCDVLVLGTVMNRGELLRRAVSRMAELALGAVVISVPEEDTAAVEELVRTGFAIQPEREVSSWLASEECPPVSALAEGFVLHTRAETLHRPHPMIERNDPLVADRLSHCSLYRPELDLVVESEGGEVAGYSLFWADPVTGVGEVEPMRVNPPFERRGIATHMLTTGLNLLVEAGCSRLLVGSALSLYKAVGFVPTTWCLTLRHEGGWIIP